MRKKKKNNDVINEVVKEKFVIPQINYDMKGLIRGKSKFQKSEMVSPIHGSNILDKKPTIIVIDSTFSKIFVKIKNSFNTINKILKQSPKAKTS